MRAPRRRSGRPVSCLFDDVDQLRAGLALHSDVLSKRSHEDGLELALGAQPWDPELFTELYVGVHQPELIANLGRHAGSGVPTAKV
jgi:hypothetical protein